MSKIIKGRIASPGIRIGKAYVYKDTRIFIPKYKISEDEVESEITRFEEALRITKEEIKSIQSQIATSLSSDMADIFSSHLMVLEDPQLDEKSKETVRKEKRNIEWVLNDITLELIDGLKSIEDEYLRERIIDLYDINKRLISKLQKTDTSSLSHLNSEVVVFASDLTPSETAMMNKQFILAFVTDRGGNTSHTAIMARALEIPAIVGTINGTSNVNDGDTVIVDAVHGVVIVDPSEEEINKIAKQQEELMLLESELAKLTRLPSETLDGKEINIYGNIEIPEEKEAIIDHGARGIGLFRTEFLFMGKYLPDEEKQFCEYRKVVEYFNPLPVTIRTLDLGGDKLLDYSTSLKEQNPYLGFRSIRFTLGHPDLFKKQLRAILKASHYGKINIMFPLISTIEEMIMARSIVKETMEELNKNGIPFDHNIPLGCMIEVPSAVLIADKLSKYSDFFSVGTNDLVQYTLAVDRINEKIAYLYNPVNISVLRLLKQIVEISDKTSTPLSICGEIAGEPRYTMVLLGLGFRNLSMSSSYMYKVKRVIRTVKIKDCISLAKDILQMELAKDIENRINTETSKKFPWLTK